MNDHAQTLWRQAKETIRETLDTSTYQIWFAKADTAGMEDDTLLLSVPNDFTKSRLENRFLPLIEDSLQEVEGKEVPVKVVVCEAREKVEPATPFPVAADKPEVLKQLNPKYTFDSFVIGSSNRFAHAAALAVAEAPARAYNPLFIYGGVGLGKTHLLQAVAHYVATSSPEMTVKFMTMEKFTNDFINAVMDKKRIKGFKNDCRNNDVLLIDDIQFLENKEGTQEEFFHTFNTLYEAGKQIAITSDRPPKEIATLEERLRSRFESGLTIDIQPPDIETRIAILRKKVKADNIVIPESEADDVLGFIAGGIPTNIRELEGAFIRVVALASLTKSEITLPLAKEALKNLLPANLERRVTIDMIQSEVCRAFGLSMSDLKGDKRSQSIVYPRQMAMYLCRELTDSSLPQIGRKFGGRDHSTVLYAVNKISKRIKEEREIFTKVQQMTTKLKNSR